MRGPNTYDTSWLWKLAKCQWHDKMLDRANRNSWYLFHGVVLYAFRCVRCQHRASILICAGSTRTNDWGGEKRWLKWSWFQIQGTISLRQRQWNGHHHCVAVVSYGWAKSSVSCFHICFSSAISARLSCQYGHLVCHILSGGWAKPSACCFQIGLVVFSTRWRPPSTCLVHLCIISPLFF